MYLSSSDSRMLAKRSYKECATCHWPLSIGSPARRVFCCSRRKALSAAGNFLGTSSPDCTDALSSATLKVCASNMSLFKAAVSPKLNDSPGLSLLANTSTSASVACTPGSVTAYASLDNVSTCLAFKAVTHGSERPTFEHCFSKAGVDERRDVAAIFEV